MCVLCLVQLSVCWPIDKRLCCVLLGATENKEAENNCVKFCKHSTDLPISLSWIVKASGTKWAGPRVKVWACNPEDRKLIEKIVSFYIISAKCGDIHFFAFYYLVFPKSLHFNYFRKYVVWCGFNLYFPNE